MSVNSTTTLTDYSTYLVFVGNFFIEQAPVAYMIELFTVLVISQAQ